MATFKLPAAVMGIALATGLSLAAFVPQTSAHSDKAPEVVEKRHAKMKELGGAMRQVKLFVDGRGSKEAAANAASTMTSIASELLSLFPEGSGMAPGSKEGAKPNIWENWEDFVAANQAFEDKAKALSAALAGDDEGAIRTAFAQVGRIGCGGCHRVFRAK